MTTSKTYDTFETLDFLRGKVPTKSTYLICGRINQNPCIGAFLSIGGDIWHSFTTNTVIKGAKGFLYLLHKFAKIAFRWN